MAFLRAPGGGLRPPLKREITPAGGGLRQTSGGGGFLSSARAALPEQPGLPSQPRGLSGAFNRVRSALPQPTARTPQPNLTRMALPRRAIDGEREQPTDLEGRDRAKPDEPQIQPNRPPVAPPGSPPPIIGGATPLPPQVQPVKPQIQPAIGDPAVPQIQPAQPGPPGGGIPPAPAGIDMTQTGPNSFTPVTPVNQPFTATDNLRGTQINPATTSGQTAALDQAFEAANQAGGGVSPEQQEARSAISQGLGSLAGPDRTQLALDSFRQFQEAGEPAFQQRLTDVGRKAAALGRIGAGMTTSELGDVQLQRERDLNRRGQELSTEAAGLTLSDRLAGLGGAVGAAGTLGGLDLGQGNLGLGRAQTLGSLGGQQFQQGLTGREELRGERGFQDQMARLAADRRIQQAQMEHNFGQDRFGNETQRLGLAGQLGLGGNPYGFLQASNQVPQGNTFGTFAGIGQGQAPAPAGGGFDPASLAGLFGGGSTAPAQGIFDGQNFGLAGQRPTSSLFGPTPTFR